MAESKAKFKASREMICSIGELGYKSRARIQGVFAWKYPRTASTT
jgi:hypothetical protein